MIPASTITCECTPEPRRATPVAMPTNVAATPVDTTGPRCANSVSAPYTAQPMPPARPAASSDRMGAYVARRVHGRRRCRRERAEPEPGEVGRHRFAGLKGELERDAQLQPEDQHR